MSLKIVSLSLALLALGLAPAANAGSIGVAAKTPFGKLQLSVGKRCFPAPQWRSKRDRYRRAHVCGRTCRTEPGYYKQVREEVWVPGDVRQVWIQPVYKTWYDDCGRARRTLIRNGYYKTVHEPGHNTYRYRKVWVPPRKVCSNIIAY